ncbi:MAG: CPBP family intramembrane glutamic endopeptidase [Candidatus Dormibacterales bacterium]
MSIRPTAATVGFGLGVGETNSPAQSGRRQPQRFRKETALLSRRVPFGVFRNRIQGRLHAGWRIVITLFLWFLGWFAVLLAVPAAVNAVFGRTGPTAYVAYQLGVAMLLVVLVIAVVRLGGWVDHRPWRLFGFVLERRWWQELTAGLVAGAAIPVAFLLFLLVSGYATISAFGHSTKAPLGAALLVVAIGSGVTAVQEEFIFRGYILRNAAEGLAGRIISARWATIIGLVVSALLFMGFHTGAASGIYLLNYLLAGLALGLAFLLTGRLALPIGMHLANNFVGAVLLTSDGAVTSIATHGPHLVVGDDGAVYWLLLVMAMIAVVTYLRLRDGSLTLHTELATSWVRTQPT